MKPKTKSYQKTIGDGKLPNFYWVFHYDEKMKRIKNEDGSISIEPIEAGENATGGCLGRFKTYREARTCVDRDAFYSHIFIEDRLSGQVFESYCVVCECCGHVEWESFEDTTYTKEELEAKGLKFE